MPQYNDAAARFGKSSNDYESGDLRDANGNAATYKTDSAYYGAHLTLGYMENLSNGANLDLYTRILWTHLDGDDTTLSTGTRSASAARTHGDGERDYVTSHRRKTARASTPARYTCTSSAAALTRLPTACR